MPQLSSFIRRVQLCISKSSLNFHETMWIGENNTVEGHSRVTLLEFVSWILVLSCIIMLLFKSMMRKWIAMDLTLICYAMVFIICRTLSCHQKFSFRLFSFLLIKVSCEMSSNIQNCNKSLPGIGLPSFFIMFLMSFFSLFVCVYCQSNSLCWYYTYFLFRLTHFLWRCLDYYENELLISCFYSHSVSKVEPLTKLTNFLNLFLRNLFYRFMVLFGNLNLFLKYLMLLLVVWAIPGLLCKWLSRFFTSGISEPWRSIWWSKHISSLCVQEYICEKTPLSWEWARCLWSALVHILDIDVDSCLEVCIHCAECWWQWRR